MRRTWLAIGLACGIVAIGPATQHAQQKDDPGSPRTRAPLTLLQINDVYTTVPVDGVGGLARVATLKKQLAAEGRTPLLIIGGDFLSPSVASTVFKGEQMVAGLNAAGLDLATFGNHEFDFGPDVLRQRMAESKWQWVASNVVDATTGQPFGTSVPYVIKTFGSLKVGFLGLCLTIDEITSDRLKIIRLINPIEAAARYVPQLKREGATVIVAITHLSYREDRELAERFPDIDVIVGGHEHFPIAATENRTLISKAGSDARFVARIDINKREGGAVERFFELIPVTAAIADDPETLSVVTAYESRLDTALDAVVGHSTVGLEATASRMRSNETNVSDMVADAIRADVGADVAIMNSGGIRGDRAYAAGPLTRRTIITMAPFGNVVCKIAAPGRVILDALNNGTSRLPFNDGRFPMISGMTIRVNVAAPVGSRVTDVMIAGQPLDLQKIYTIAASDYQLKGGDGYAMFMGQRVLIAPESGSLVSAAIEKYVASRPQISPTVEGRITIAR